MKVKVDWRVSDDAGPSRPGAVERDASRPTIYLYPGELFASSEPYAVTTILGSCVAVCLWDPVLRVGGINHYLLPFYPGGGPFSPRFGNVAVQHLIEKLLNLGSVQRSLQAKVFGGGCVFEAFGETHHHVGMKNVEVARTVLDSQGVPVVEDDVGGRKGRKLVFHVDDGTTRVEPL